MDPYLSAYVSSDAVKDDPLLRALAPPSDETPEERTERIRQEIEAKQRSDMLDLDIDEARQRGHGEDLVVKVVLLGQSESGKTTILKNFQLAQSESAFKDELPAWRRVIQLNLVHSVQIILDALTKWENKLPRLIARQRASHDYREDSEATSISTLQLDEPSDEPERESLSPLDGLPILTSHHKSLRMKLGPLAAVEQLLVSMIVPPDVLDVSSRRRRTGSSGSEISLFAGRQGTPAFGPDWKEKMREVRRMRSPSRSPHRVYSPPRSPLGGSMVMRSSEEVADMGPTGLISNMKEDIKALWRDRVVKAVLKREGILLETKSGFFLDSVDRIADFAYIPSNEDIIRARLKTLGVTQHEFCYKRCLVKRGDEPKPRIWHLFDVGGSRTHRQAWAPYFDDVNTIIFLAPLSTFDENLAEDPSINRLEDSYLLWKEICSNKLLAKAHLVLLLNKIDILKAKIDAGIKVKDFIKSYHTREKPRKNDANSVTRYFKSKFVRIEEEYTPAPRMRTLVVHQTCATNITSMAKILQVVQEAILIRDLRDAYFLT